MYPPLQTVDPLFYKHAGTSTVYTSNTARDFKSKRNPKNWSQTYKGYTFLAKIQGSDYQRWYYPRLFYLQHLKQRNNLKQLTAEGDANQV